jgi:hypothetical protein
MENNTAILMERAEKAIHFHFEAGRLGLSVGSWFRGFKQALLDLFENGLGVDLAPIGAGVRIVRQVVSFADLCLPQKLTGRASNMI